MYKRKSVFDTILDIIIILLSILVIYWMLQLIFVGSPGLVEFNFAVIFLLSGFVIKIYREIGEIKMNMKHSFINIKNDINLIKKRLKVNYQ